MNEEMLKFVCYLTGESDDQVKESYAAYQKALVKVKPIEGELVQLFGKPHRKVVSLNGRVELFEV